jgi:hypothetical protein
MSTVVDYRGRQADILAFKDIEPNKDSLTTMALARENDGGEITAGIQKLAQRWLLEMLTEEGTIPWEPERGTLFMTQLRLGLVRTTIEAEQLFFFAEDQARLNLILEEDDDMPDDERFGSASLVSLAVNGDLLVVRAELTSRAGKGVTLLMPLSVTLE